MIISISRVPNAEPTPLDPMIAEYSLSVVRAGPKGTQGDAGWTPTIAIVADGVRRVLRVTGWTGGAGTSPASGVYVGPSGFVSAIADATDFRGPDGQVTTITIGTVVTLPEGTTATVVNVGTPYAAILNFAIPRGDVGDTASVAVGTVTTLAPGQPATVVNAGSSVAAVFNFGIPAGAAGGLTSIGVVVPTGLAVSPASLTTNGTFTMSYAAGYTGYTSVEKTKLAGVTALADPTGATIHAATAKTTPVDADEIGYLDSAASYGVVKTTVGAFKARQILSVREEQPSGTYAGASVSGYQTRTLNTVQHNSIPGASLASNAVILPAGRYRFTGSAPALASNQHRVRLYDVTAAVIAAVGQNAYNGGGSTSYAQTSAMIDCVLTFAVTTTVRLDHFIAIAQAVYGLGLTTSSGDPEVYSSLLIEKIG